MQVCEKVGKSRVTAFFKWFVAWEGRKVGSLKRRVQSHVARWEMKSCTPCGANHISKSKCRKHTMFWKLRCWKSARRCGAKHISKSKCTKQHTMFGPLFDVQMSRKCTSLWREAHFQAKIYKTTHHVRTTFGSWDVEKVHAVVAWSTFPSPKCKKLTSTEHFWRSDVVLPGRRKGLWTFPKVSKRWGFCGNFKYNYNYTTLNYTTVQLHYNHNHNYNYNNDHNHNYATLHYTTLDYTTVHYSTLHDTRPITPLQYNCKYTTLTTVHHNYNSTTLQLQLQLHYTTLRVLPAVCGWGDRPGDHCNH